MKKNGFISTTLIYSFFSLFLIMMVFLLNSYSSSRFLREQYKYEIKNSFAEASGADIDLYIMVWNNVTQDYELKDEMPTFGYNYEPSFSYCKNGSSIAYLNGNISVSALRKDSCYAYFTEAERDVVLKIYTKESASGDKVLVKKVPNVSYKLTNQTCTNGATLKFDEATRKFSIESKTKTVCEVEFTKRESDIILHIYKESVLGTHEYNGLKYVVSKTAPGINYTFNSYVCLDKNVNTVIDYKDGEILIDSEGKNECSVYFDGSSSKVELIIMQENDIGTSGYTTGLKYIRSVTIPGLGYKYVGYLCEDSTASVKYENGTFETNATSQTICRAYFNKYSSNVLIKYYLETSTGSYENVSSVPSLGYVYNDEKSFCQNDSEIIVDNNIVMIAADANVQDECNIYFDMINADIKLNVYVMNRESQKYEKGNIPTVGYTLYNAACTNGAIVEYINNNLKVTSEGPTVCTVYFR